MCAWVYSCVHLLSVFLFISLCECHSRRTTKQKAKNTQDTKIMAVNCCSCVYMQANSNILNGVCDVTYTVVVFDINSSWCMLKENFHNPQPATLSSVMKWNASFVVLAERKCEFHKQKKGRMIMTCNTNQHTLSPKLSYREDSLLFFHSHQERKRNQLTKSPCVNWPVCRCSTL